MKRLNEIEQFFDQRSFSYATRVRFATRKLIGRAQVFWEEFEYMRFIKQEPNITDWEDMKVKFQDEYLPQYFQAKYIPQSYYGNSQGQQGNLRYRNNEPIAPFEENCSIRITNQLHHLKKTALVTE